MDTNKIIAYETDELSEIETIKMFQSAINSGMAWRLQGSYGREAMEYINAGLCLLGKLGHRDYWGNYVPARDEVVEGTKGSEAYVEARSGEDHLAMLKAVK